jgi:hypothetical protein
LFIYDDFFACLLILFLFAHDADYEDELEDLSSDELVFFSLSLFASLIA